MVEARRLPHASSGPGTTARGRAPVPTQLLPPAASLDHLVGAREEKRRKVEAKCARRAEIEDEVEADGALHREITRPRPVYNSARYGAGPAEEILKVGAVGDEAAVPREVG